MSFRGSLDSFNLADILQTIAMNKTTGGLRLYDDKAEKCVYFQEGEVGFMTIAGGKLIRLAEMLVGQGVATSEEIKLSRLKQAKSKGSFAEGVVEAELMSRDDLGLLVRSRVEEEIYSLFHWAHAEFEFDEGVPTPYNVDPDQSWVQVRFNTSSLIMEAARRIDELERMRAKVPSAREVFVAAGEGASEGDLSPIEGRMLFLLDGSRDVDDLAQETFFSAYEITRALCNFLDRGLVRVAPVELLRQRVLEVRDSGDLRRAVKLYERILSMSSEDIDARKALAEAASQARDHDKAAIHFSVLAEEALRAGDGEDEAIAIYKRILSLIPKHPASHEKLASIFLSRGWKSEAVKHYQALVQARIEAGRLEEARVACLKAVEVDPDSPDARGSLARIYLAMKDPKHALEQLELLGDSYRKLGRSRAAAEAYKRALQIDKSVSRLKKKLAEVTTSGGVLRLKKALAVSSVSLLLALFLAGGAVGVREFITYRKYAVAHAKARTLADECKYDEAVALYKPFLATRWSLTGVPQRAKMKVKEMKMLMKSTQKSAAHEARKRSATLLEGTLESWKKGDYAESRRLGRRALTSGALKEEEKEEVQALVSLLNDEEAAETKLRGWFESKADFENEEDLRIAHGKVRKFVATWRARQDDFIKEHGLKLRPEEHPSRLVFRWLTLHTKIDCELPAAAEVFVGGELKGKAPVVISYPFGSPPSVVVRKEGFREHKVPRGELGPVVRVWLVREYAWSRRVKGEVSVPPSCWDGTVVVGSSAGSVHAFDARTGRRAWTNYASDESLCGILTRILRTETCYVFAGRSVHGFGLERPSTERAFSIECSSAVLGDIAASRLNVWSDRLVGIAASKREIVAFDATKGDELWRKRVNVLLTSPPELTQALIYLGAEDRNVHAVYGFGVGKGEMLKRWPTRDRVKARPLVFGGDLFVADGSGRVCCLDAEAENAEPKWTFSAGAPVTQEMFLDREHEALYLCSDDGALRALSMRTGARLWESPFRGEGHPVGPPQPGKGRIYFATVSAVYALDSSDATPIWKFTPPGGVSGGLCFDGGRLYVGSRSGGVYCFEEVDG